MNKDTALGLMLGAIIGLLAGIECALWMIFHIVEAMQ